MSHDKLFEHKQYSLPVVEKEKFLFDRLLHLHKHHLSKSEDYRKISQLIFNKPVTTVADILFLPVSIFKNHEIKSIDTKDVFKVITSSGTTGTIPSRIFLDRETAVLQTKALTDIMQFVLGKERLPMLIIDTIDVIKNRNSFSARGAGILGMSVFGKSHFYLLNADMTINYEGLKEFLSKYDGKPMLLFGFTYLVWQYLVESSVKADLSNAILIHSGGWKKMLERAVDNTTFKKKLKEKFGLSKVYNFYGMVEQIGSVFLECECGYLHTPNFAEVIIRNPYDFTEGKIGEEGVIQVLSALPESYPGHSLLTEDLGKIIGEDDCKCGRKGRYFSISGRMKKAELRGCSDTFINAEAN
jgi:phenylacetate-coenzyme A ligase PaaK-like adenylate-forming protein